MTIDRIIAAGRIEQLGGWKGTMSFTRYYLTWLEDLLVDDIPSLQIRRKIGWIFFGTGWSRRVRLLDLAGTKQRLPPRTPTSITTTTSFHDGYYGMSRSPFSLNVAASWNQRHAP